MEITSLSGSATIKAILKEQKTSAVQLLESLAKEKNYNYTKSNFSKKMGSDLFYLYEIQLISDVLGYDLYLIDTETKTERKFQIIPESKMFYNDFLRTMTDLKYQIAIRARQ